MAQSVALERAAGSTASLRKRARPVRRSGTRAAAPLRVNACNCSAVKVYGAGETVVAGAVACPLTKPLAALSAEAPLDRLGEEPCSVMAMV